MRMPNNNSREQLSNCSFIINSSNSSCTRVQEVHSIEEKAPGGADCKGVFDSDESAITGEHRRLPNIITTGITNFLKTLRTVVSPVENKTEVVYKIKIDIILH